MGTVRAIMQPLLWGREMYQSFRRSDICPDIIKSYGVRRHLPVRIFYPASYKVDTGSLLPVLLTIHGGGFSLFNVRDDDRWNRHFADTQDTIVIGLNHSLAPFYPYPTLLHDIEAILLSVAADSTIPINRRRMAISKSSSRANLAFAVSQLESVRAKLDRKAAFSSGGLLQLEVPAELKATTRHYKTNLDGLRGATKDFLRDLLAQVQWSYTSHGTSQKDPLYSPYHAQRDQLPGASLLRCSGARLPCTNESWRMACLQAGRRVPDITERVGRPEVGVEGAEGALELKDETFAFEDHQAPQDERIVSSVTWLLVPDVTHSFD
ncbi:alpha/beta-hydrolase [Thozetella sp. PMI_491]|nr:alpha/beta-hydrolase [Thozetella sp. PMI_491]